MVQFVCQGGCVVLRRVVLGGQVHVVGLADPGEGEGQPLLLPLHHDRVGSVLPGGLLLWRHPYPIVEGDDTASWDVLVGKEALSSSLHSTVSHPHHLGLEGIWQMWRTPHLVA